MTRRLLPSLLAAAALLALPAAAPAAVTIGSNLTGTPADNLGSYCPGGGFCTGTNLALPATSTAANGLTSPINGVVVRWRVKTGSTGNNPVAFRVLRSAGGTSFTGAGTSATESLNASTVNATTGVAEFSTRVAIRTNDSAGLNPGNSALVWANTPGATGVVWGSVNSFPSGLADNQTAAGDGQTAKELLVQAVVEPDADKDGFGDETQDGCPGDPARQTPPCGTGQTNPGGNPPATPPGTTSTSPVISSARVTPASFRLGSLARIRFTLSQKATYTLTFDQALAGRRRGTRCVRQSRTVRTGTRCTVFRRRAVRTGSGVAGANSLTFRGRVAGKALPLGRYRVSFGARNAARSTAVARTARFTLRAAARRR
ncbi:MAG: hypothetical protein QOE65_2819 [Solirubrobacteraceae bacterium]|nr:hypothetical protein [Solirubrobacteraceae bacterium]